ncbi:MAG TPA: hypothetical protein VF175_03855 [Lacipirellula sp.]
MARRPILLLSLFLLGAAVVQAAVVSLRDDTPRQKGEVCTACGPIR